MLKFKGARMWMKLGKSVLVCSMVLGSTFSVQAAEVVKILDSQKALCPEPSSANYSNNEMILTMRVVKDSLILQFVKCQEGRLLPVTSNKNHQYMFDGITVSESYSQFKLLIQSENLSEVRTLSLSNLGEMGAVTLPLSALRLADRQSVDLQVQSKRLTKASSGYADFDFINWGTFRLKF